MHSVQGESDGPVEEVPLPKKRRSSADSVLQVFLGAALKARWAAHCEDAGVAAGAPLRGYVEAQLSGRGQPDPLKSSAGRCDALPGPAEAGYGVAQFMAMAARRRAVRLVARPDEGRRVERSVYFTPSEAMALEAASGAARMGLHEYVVAAVRAAVSHTPTFGQDELEALTASGALLAGVVVDLARWRREVSETELSARLGALEAAVKAHVEASCQALAQGTRRWEIRV